jgi:hypothetical protein
VIEKHNPGEFSNIKVCEIYKTPAIGGGTIEFIGYKLNDKKAMIITAGTSYTIAPTKGKPGETGGTTVYIELNFNQVKSILDNYKTLEEKIKKEQPVARETVYYDFTPSPDLFISFSRSYGAFANQSANNMHLWIGSEKFTLPSSAVIENLEEFVAY